MISLILGLTGRTRRNDVLYVCASLIVAANPLVTLGQVSWRNAVKGFGETSRPRLKEF